MAELTNQQKKDFAKSLFIHESLTQEEIAARVGANRRTIARWIETERWKAIKASFTITREEQVKNLYNQLAALNDAIATREEGKRYATPAEADAIGKLAGAISKLETETGIAEIVTVSKGLLDFIRKIDVEKAKEISYYLDAFVKARIA